MTVKFLLGIIEFSFIINLLRNTGTHTCTKLALGFCFSALLGGVFYFLNIFSHGELPPHCEQRFLPCEIGCVKYSLQEGIIADFHSFIHPGKILKLCDGFKLASFISNHFLKS